MNKFSKIITLVLSLLLLSSLPSKAWVMDVWELRGVTADEVSEATIAFKEKAMAGGAITASGTNDNNVIMSIYNSFVNSNEATNTGGGIYLNQTISNIIDTTFNQNIAGSYGGAMSIFYSDATFKAIVISNNTAAYFGGGMYIMGKTNNDGPFCSFFF